MTTIKNFIAEEINNNTRNIILITVEQGKALNKYKDELVFNRYSLEFFFQQDLVIIYDDIFTEYDPLKITLDEFLKAISNC
ncbi:hypothetical protein [Chryseobacterium profundimaris]|uniref:Uncharacterized protein n=1 Tax=Chryseobacterium profundimaris TaxID=1387275 RepID=A0ABY1P933_9FLAO|nr:hypothetical protein [Chryseobacterium profundimaris]SMP29230.1 hypothetical protein SAMN06264346_11189 [Chryseobacterium profundimaris]